MGLHVPQVVQRRFRPVQLGATEREPLLDELDRIIDAVAIADLNTWKVGKHEIVGILTGKCLLFLLTLLDHLVGRFQSELVKLFLDALNGNHRGGHTATDESGQLH